MFTVLIGTSLCTEQLIYVGRLIHLCRMDSSTITLWTHPFPIEGVSRQFYYYHVFFVFFFFRNSVISCKQCRP